jgi:hypothetical protein
VYAEHPTAFWLILVMDLGIVIPTAFIVAALLRRHPHRPVRLAVAVGGLQMLLCAAVTGMGLVMLMRDDQTASMSLFVARATATLGFTVVYVTLLRRVAPKGESPTAKGLFADGRRRYLIACWPALTR